MTNFHTIINGKNITFFFLLNPLNNNTKTERFLAKRDLTLQHTHKTQLVVLSCVPTRNRPVTNPGVTSHSLRNADCRRVEDTFGSQSSSRRLYCENDIWAAERASVVRCSLGDVRHITRLSLCIYFSIILLGFTVGSILGLHCGAPK